MKSMKVFFIAALMIFATALSSFGLAGASVQQQQKPELAAPGKQQKDKKPAEEDVPGQDDQEVKLGTQLVTVPFNVTDKKNRYINELTKDDLEILEDNKPQQVFSFTRQTDLPITIAMLIDISGSQEYTLSEEKEAGLRFFQKVLRPKKDLGAVVTFEHESVLVQDLTDNIQKLERAIRDVEISIVPGSTSPGMPPAGTPPINPTGAGSTAMFDSIYSVSSDLLRREAGRRVIILLTDGNDTSSRVKMREAIERTWRSEIIVYSIGIADPRVGINKGDLKKIAAETGGRAFFPGNFEDLDRAFAQIDEDLRSQYIVSYEPGNEAKDGSFRTIQVRVKNQKDLTVRHRRGYFAPKA
jgi:Ca-activated chloride channel homolog